MKSLLSSLAAAALVAFFALPITGRAEPLAVGAAAPALKSVDQNGKEVGLLCRTALSVNIYNNFFHIKSSKKRSAPQFYGLHCV